MSTRASGSASVPPPAVSPAILRLLPRVHHPPAGVLLIGAEAAAAALHARGYRVQLAGSDVLEVDWGGRFDLLCDTGLLGDLAPTARDRYFAVASWALRPGGQLFGVVRGVGASELIHRASGSFEVARLEPAPGESADALEVVLVRR